MENKEDKKILSESEKTTAGVSGGVELFFKSKSFGVVMISVGVLAALSLVFLAGEAVESRKADFSYNWGGNYYRNLVGPLPPPPLDMAMGNNFMMGNGTAGSIIKIDNSTLTIKDERGGSEKTVVVGSDTAIRHLRDALKLNDLKLNDDVVVIGSPNNSGQIEAKLIRVMQSDGDINSNNN